MVKHRVYISASTQRENIGLATYGNEQERMMALSDRVKYWLLTQTGQFDVFRNEVDWTLEKTIQDCNNLACEIFVDNHSNAGSLGAAGSEAYFHAGSVNGERLANALYKRIAPVSPGKDRGVMKDTVLYSNGLYVLRETYCPATLMEHFFHSNIVEVKDFLVHSDIYAYEEARAICDYFDTKWIPPTVPVVQNVVDSMFTRGWITDKQHWTNVLNGVIPCNKDFLTVVLQRALK